MANQTHPVSYATPAHKKSLGERFNLRILLFVAALAVLIGVPAWTFVDTALSGGIHKGADGYTRVDFKSMVTFPFDQEVGRLADVPDRFRALDGKPVELVGEIAPSSSAGHRIGDFSLVYSVAKCCYSGPPQIQHFVQSQVDKGAKVDYAGGQVVVRGILHVDVTRDNGVITGVYHLDVKSLEPV